MLCEGVHVHCEGEHVCEGVHVFCEDVRGASKNV